MALAAFEHLLKPEAESAPIDRARLERHLAGQGLALDPGFPIRQLKGGLANINYLLRVDDALAVLRRPPGGELPPGAHDMGREHRILSVLWQVLPVAPRSFYFTDDTAVIGVPFQLIEFRQGLVIRGGTLPPLAMDGAEAARRLSTMLIETLADIHGVDTGAIGLGDLGHPQGFVERAVAGWSRRGQAAAFDAASRALVAELSAWLGARTVEAGDATLLHNDFKLDNMILDPETLAPVAVLDWDMGTRGDPRFDLATLLSYWTEPGDPDCMHRLAQMPSAAPGFPSREEAAAAYARLTGRDLGDFRTFRVLTMFKLGVVFLQLYALYRTGRVEDAQYAAFGSLGTELMDVARALAEGRYF